MVDRKRPGSMSFRRNNNSQAPLTKTKESILELKEIQNMLKYEWPQCLSENANPIEIAVSLLDDTSVGLAHKLGEFREISQQTKSALRHVVDEHHEIFNNSIGSYHMLLSSMNSSSEDLADIKQYLEEITKDIHDRSETLNELSQTSIRYVDMIDILDAMDNLSTIPDKIDQLVMEKKIHEVYDVISQGFKIAEKYNLWSLPAMAGTKSQLEIQSNNLFDMIVDEIQNELYMKNSPFADSGANNREFYSWATLFNSHNPRLISLKTLIFESQSLEQYIYNSANLDITEVAECFNENVDDFIKTQLPKIHTHYLNNSDEIDYSILFDSKSNQASESFHYLYMLLNTASKLNRLTQVVQILSSNVQMELHSLINRVTDEVKHKRASELAQLNKIHHIDQSQQSDIFGSSSFNDTSVTVLQDLFGQILIKCLAVLQRHKIVSEIVNLIESANSLPSTAKSHNSSVTNPSDGANGPHPYDFDSVWNIIKREIQSLINNYIYGANYFTNSIGEKQFDKENRIRDDSRNLSLFKFENISFSETRSPEDLQDMLQDMFPGLNSARTGKGDDTLLETSSPYIKNETFNALVEVLVPKSVFNMRIILEFLLIFTVGSHDLFIYSGGPPNKTDITPALQAFDAYMKHTFLGFLRQNLENSYAYSTGINLNLIKNDRVNDDHVVSFNDITKLEEEPLQGLGQDDSSAPVSIYENALVFKRMFINTCAVLNTSLSYRHHYCDLVVDFAEKFTEAYQKRHQELLMISNVNSANDQYLKPSMLISSWILNQYLADLSVGIMNAKHEEERRNLIHEESTVILRSFADDHSFSKDDYLDNESFDHVCNLLTTTQWILGWLPQVKRESDVTDVNDATEGKPVKVDKLKDEWCFLETGKANTITTLSGKDITDQNIYLALNAEKSLKFDKIVQTFELIKKQSLLALRYDVISKVSYFIEKSFRQGDWFLSTEPGDSDQFISQMSQELFAINNRLSSVLKKSERGGVFYGLSEFVDITLVDASKHVQKINSNGVKKVMLNIHSLQQIMRNVSADSGEVDFTRSTTYFNLFTLNENTLLSTIKHNQYGYSLKEVENMVRMIYSEKLANGNGSTFNKTKYNDLRKKVADMI